MERVYLETTLIRYLCSRPSRDLLVAAHQQVTSDWWTSRRETFDCFVSQISLMKYQRVIRKKHGGEWKSSICFLSSK